MIKKYHHEDFKSDVQLYMKKKQLHSLISCIIPAFNEESTIYNIIKHLKEKLIENVPIIDEIIVMDCNSNDATALLAQKAGAQVYSITEVGDHSIISGKGTALWKALSVANGDIIVCIDADIKNFSPRFVSGLIGPLLYEKPLLFVKAFYNRPIIIDNVLHNDCGGRITEVLVRPLLSMFYPELAQLYQPLSGEYSFRRYVGESIPFFSGYGVDLGLIFEMYNRYGLSCVA